MTQPPENLPEKIEARGVPGESERPQRARWTMAAVLGLVLGAASVFTWIVLANERWIFVGRGLGRWVPEVVLVFGTLLATFVAMVLHLVWAARQKAAELAVTNRRLEAEVEQRKAAAEAVKAERRRLHDILDRLPSYVILLDRNYGVSFANRYFEEHFGKSEGRRCYEYLFQRETPCENCETFKVLKTCAPHHWEWTGPDSRTYDIHDFPFTDVDGSPLVIEMGIDITERQQAGKKLEHLNRALRLVSACNQALACASEETDLLQRICDLAVELGGYRLAWIGYAQDDARKTVRPMAKSGTGTEYVTDEMVTWGEDERGRGPTGRVIRTAQPVFCSDTLADESFVPWRERALEFGFRSSLVVPLARDGKAFGALSIYGPEPSAFGADEVALFSQLAEDLSFGIEALRTRAERERAEQQLRAASSYARSLLEASLDPMVTISPEGIITDVNQATEAATGRTRAELIGTKFSEYFTDPENALRGYRQVFETGWVRDYPLALRHQSGRTMDVLYNASVYHNDAGQVEGVFAAARDITERKQAEQRLARYAQELERSNSELQEFAFVASHDLQEPLRKITAFSDRLRDRCAGGGQLDEVGLDFLKRMHGAALRMGRLIESLLEYSRLATRAVPFEDVDLAAICVGVIADLEERIRDTGARVTVQILPRVLGDPIQLRQLLQNLLANALKFHAPGKRPGIAVWAVRRDQRWEVSVSDDGIGFDPAYTDRIFRPFQRLHGHNEYEGSGMGLAICRKIAQRHGASISVESQPGKGSTFTISLPAIEERKEPCPTEPQCESSSPKTMTTITC